MLLEVVSISLTSKELEGDLEVSGLPYIRDLSLENGRIRGSLEGLTTLTTLTGLYLGSNKIRGDLEPLEHLSNLESLDLEFNQFRGPLTPLQNLHELKHLMLPANRVTKKCDINFEMFL